MSASAHHLNAALQTNMVFARRLLVLWSDSTTPPMLPDNSIVVYSCDQPHNHAFPHPSIIADGPRLPFLDNSFTDIWSMGFLAAQPARAMVLGTLGAMRRVLVPGGVLRLAEPTSGFWSRWLSFGTPTTGTVWEQLMPRFFQDYALPAGFKMLSCDKQGGWLNARLQRL